MLEWVVETQGYEVLPLDTASVSDAEYDERLDTFLAKQPLTATGKVVKGVSGDNNRIARRLHESPKFDSVKRKNAVLWFRAGENVLSVETERSEP